MRDLAYCPRRGAAICRRARRRAHAIFLDTLDSIAIEELAYATHMLSVWEQKLLLPGNIKTLLSEFSLPGGGRCELTW